MLISSIGAVIGIALVVAVSPHLVGHADVPFIVASMGAAAVLLYAAPHSPLTQPWSFVGGHLTSAVVGVSCALWVPDLFIAAGLAVGLAIFAMHQLNCLHPPGGAAALVAVVGGDQIHALGYLYVLMPVGLNVVILGSAVWLTRSLLARWHQKNPFIFYSEEELQSTEAAAPENIISSTDLKHALQNMHTYIDVSIEDLQQVYTHASLAAQHRQLHGMNCKDRMTQLIPAVEFGDYLDETWALMQQHGLKSIPVIDRARRVIGIISVSDFQQAAATMPGTDIEQQLKLLIHRSGTLSANKAEVAGQLMSSSVITLAEESPLSEAVAIFAEHRFSQIPVINAERRLSGMLSRACLSTASPLLHSQP